jgi:hypothetical protein
MGHPFKSSGSAGLQSQSDPNRKASRGGNNHLLRRNMQFCIAIYAYYKIYKKQYCEFLGLHIAPKPVAIACSP